MIVAVTLNIAVDLTYHVDALRPEATHRVGSVSQRAGGKGVNVARVARQLGAEVMVTGFCGGRTGDEVRADLDAAGMAHRLHPIAGTTRRTVTVVDAASGGATLFNEPGPTVSTPEWQEMCALYQGFLPRASAIVLSGSLPPGVPADAYATLTRLARAYAVPVLLDADGPALLAGLPGRPAVVKPNADELTEATGFDDPLTAAKELRAQGADAVVCSRGAGGLLAVTGEGCWLAKPPRKLDGNPTGAGDAAVAALAVGLVREVPWPKRLRLAAAVSAAAVLTPVAGGFDEIAYQELLPEIVLQAEGETS